MFYNFYSQSNDTIHFVTDNDIIYDVEFKLDHYHLGDFYFQKMFSLSIIPITDSLKYPLDKKLENTIIFICQQFLQSPDRILTFTCESLDGKQIARWRKFTYWFDKHNTTHIKKDILIEMDDTKMYAAIVYHKDCSFRTNLENDIDATYSEYQNLK